MKKEAKKCLNCGNMVEDTYCSKCGQSIHVARISPKHLVEELEYGLLHINKGILKTVKELLLRPGLTIKNYLSGKRVKYTKPFVFLIIWGAVYSLIFHYFHFFPMSDMNNQNSVILEYIPLYKWYSEHYSLTVLLLIPFYALSTYLLFYKKGYNYVEHLVLFSYLNGAKIFLVLLLYPLLYLSKSVAIYQIAHVLIEIYLIGGLSQFFKSHSWFKSVSKVISSLVLALLFALTAVVIAFLILRHFNIRL